MAMAILVLLALFAAAPAASSEDIKPITVCDLLANLPSYEGKTIAVVGEFAAGEEGYWLVQDVCPQNLKTDEFTWGNVVWMEFDDSSRSALNGKMSIEPLSLKAKLGQLNSWRNLRTSKRGWAVVLGRIESRLRIRRAADGRVYGLGLGHLGGAPVQVVYRKEDVKVFSGKEAARILSRK